MRIQALVQPFALSLLLAAAIAAGGCSQKSETAAKADNTPPTRYAMHGVVLRVDPQLHVATIKAGKIEGWMEAMTMEYPVRDQQEFQQLKVGENLDATVFVKSDDFWIGEIKEAPATPAPADAVPPASK